MLFSFPFIHNFFFATHKLHRYNKISILTHESMDFLQFACHFSLGNQSVSKFGGGGLDVLGGTTADGGFLTLSALLAVKSRRLPTNSLFGQSKSVSRYVFVATASTKWIEQCSRDSLITQSNAHIGGMSVALQVHSNAEWWHTTIQYCMHTTTVQGSK